jgi:hypothetical protein
MNRTSFLSSDVEQRKSSVFFFFLFIMLSIFGTVLLFWATAPWGIGVSVDSVAYIDGARQILEGKGYCFADSDPITHWPPLFSVFLAGIGLLGIDPIGGARILNSLLFGLNIGIVGIILKRFTGSTKIAFWGLWFMLTSRVMTEVHTMAWSEPLFIFFALLGYALLGVYLFWEKKSWLVSGACCIGLACLVRYAGIAFVAAGILSLLLLGRKNFFERIKDSLIFAVLGTLPFSLWLVRNYSLTQNPTSRTFRVLTPSRRFFESILNTFSNWAAPLNSTDLFRFSILAIIVLVFFVMLLMTLRRERQESSAKASTFIETWRVHSSIVILILCYLGLYVAHHFFVNVNTTASPRHLSPLFVAWLLFFLILLDRFLKFCKPRRVFKILLILFGSFLGVAYSVRSGQLLAEAYNEGRGFRSRLWQTSQTVGFVKNLPSESLLYSNEPPVIYFTTGRSAYRLPNKFSKKHVRKEKARIPSEKYISQLSRIKRRLKSDDAYVIFFNERHMWYKAPEEELKAYLSLSLVERFSDGVVYRSMQEGKKIVEH